MMLYDCLDTVRSFGCICQAEQFLAVGRLHQRKGLTRACSGRGDSGGLQIGGPASEVAGGAAPAADAWPYGVCPSRSFQLINRCATMSGIS